MNKPTTTPAGFHLIETGVLAGISMWAAVPSPATAAQGKMIVSTGPTWAGEFGSTIMLSYNASDINLQPLGQELCRIAEASRAVVGVALRHIETGRSLSINGEMLFPMASTKKVGLAAHILNLVDQDILRLDTLITLTEQDIYTPQGGPVGTFFGPGSTLSLRDLLTLTLVASDNNATDILYRIGGGSVAVEASLQSLGLPSLQPGLPTWMSISNIYGHATVLENDPISPNAFRKFFAVRDTAKDDGENARIRSAENSLTRDSATPVDMARLVTKLWNGEFLSHSSTKIVLDCMFRCITGENSIKGMLPVGTRVAHKTGTLEFAVNDVGVIELPGRAGHLVAAVYTKDSYEPSLEKREAVIAHIARAAYDFFLFAVSACPATAAHRRVV
ncbi:class A beta-lactamase-related serine hydrolase [Mesorhizobium australicum]|uniref:serine hydrolase n=1 Tax=Mesorhizobium australicum TaxID=536018 RepID=UPI00333B2273